MMSIPLSGPSYTSGNNKSRVTDLTKPETWPSLNPLWRKTALHCVTTSSVNPWRWVNLQSLTWGMTKPPPTLRLIVISLTYLLEHYHAMTKQDRSYSQDYDRSWGDWQNTPMSVWYDKYSHMVPAIGVYIWERIGQETQFNQATWSGWRSVFHGKRTDTICVPQKLLHVECHIRIVWKYIDVDTFLSYVC